MKAFAKLIWVFSLILVNICLAKINQSSVPKVVVSIKPIHSLTQQLMAGTNNSPKLIFTGQQSPHHAPVTAKQLKLIRAADLIIWIGPDYATRMGKSIKLRKKSSELITLLQDKLNLQTYAPRSGKLWAGGNHKDHHRHNHQDHNHKHHHNCCHNHSIDPHIWLDPRNAKVIVTAICKKLKEIDPINKRHYEANKVKVMEKLDNLITSICKKISPHKGQPYIIYHDSTQYYDKYFGINAVGSIVLEPGIPVSAGHIKKLRSYLSSHASVPVFVEIPHSKEPIKKYFYFPGIKSGAMEPVKIGSVDPVGIGVKAGPDAYFDILHHLTDNIVVQLERSS